MKTFSNDSLRRAILGLITVAVLTVIAFAFPMTAKADTTTPLAKVSAAAKGRVTAISPTSITIHNHKDNTDATFAIAPTTTFTLDGKDATIADITVGLHVEVVSADGKTADKIHAHASKPGDTKGGAPKA